MNFLKRLCFVLPMVFFMACKGPHKKSGRDAVDTAVTPRQMDSAKTTMDEMPDKAKTGIGPIKHKVVLGEQINQTMADKGKKLFNNKCSGCHSIHESAVGPALGGVLEERSPQWVMNMILNPEEMIEKNPQVQAMKAQYEAKMVDLDLSKREAREIVEYLRNY